MEEAVKPKVQTFCCCNIWVSPHDTRLVVADNRRYHASCLKRQRRLAGEAQHDQLTFKFVSQC